MKETILIVGEDEALSSSRAALLHEWQVVTAQSKDAAATILARQFDLLLLCQTVPDESARKLIVQARVMNPGVQVLAISHEDQRRRFDSKEYEVQLNNPGWLRDAVASLLSSSTSTVE